MKRFRLGWTSLLLLAVLATGCANRPSWTSAGDPNAEFSVQLPSIVLQIDETGAVENELLVGPIADIAPALNSLFSEEQVGKFVASNVQHLQVDMHDKGLSLWLNGQPMFGSSRFRIEELGDAMDALAILSGDTPGDPESTFTQLKSILPVMKNLSAGVIFEFPVQGDVRAVPYADARDFHVMSDQELAAIEAAAQGRGVVAVPIDVAEDGSLTVGNFMLNMMLSMMPGDMAKVPDGMLETVAETGITQIALKTRAAGLTLGINGAELPLLLWNNGELDNLIALLKDEAFFNAFLPDQDMGSLTLLFDTLLPVLTTANFDLELNFPA